MVKISIFSWFGYELSLSEKAGLIRDAGFSSTFLWLGDEEDSVSAGRWDDMPGIVRDCGLTLENAHAPYIHSNFLWSDSRVERESIESEYRNCISFCSRHTVPILVIHVCRGATPPPFNKKGLEIIHNLIASAEESGVILAVENTRLPQYLDFVFNNSSSAHLRFCYDSSHDFLYGDPPGSILQSWGHLLAETHFSDNNGEIDDHWLPGEGRNDWDPIYASFPSDTYGGSISLEVVPKPEDDRSPDVFLTNAYQKVNLLREKLIIREV